VHRIEKIRDSISVLLVTAQTVLRPNAALTPPLAASASSECVRSAVTDAGCASNATPCPPAALAARDRR